MVSVKRNLFSRESRNVQKMDDVAELRKHLREYRDADDKLRVLNEQVSSLRETRKEKEHIITELLSTPKFSTFDKLKLEDDGSTIQIQRPSQWNKPWSLSKATLYTYLRQYFQSTQGPDADSCYTFIETQHKRQLVSTEFALTRHLPKDVWNK
jgi:hypothetical protein